MKIRVLGGFGSELPCCNLTGFLLNDSIILDAGTVSASMTASEISAITHVVLSHAHLDHTKGLPFLADNLVGRKSFPVEVVAAEAVLEAVHAHIFNDEVWPDFTRIPSRKSPVFKFRKLAPGRETRLGGLTFKAFWVNHTIPTTGFIIKEGDSAVLYSGDTKATDGIWAAANKLGDRLKAVFVETSFPNRMQALAEMSAHLTPRSLGAELRKLKDYDGPVYVYHVKSQYMMDIEREIDALGRKDIIVVRDGMEWDI